MISKINRWATWITVSIVYMKKIIQLSQFGVFYHFFLRQIKQFVAIWHNGSQQRETRVAQNRRKKINLKERKIAVIYIENLSLPVNCKDDQKDPFFLERTTVHWFWKPSINDGQISLSLMLAAVVVSVFSSVKVMRFVWNTLLTEQPHPNKWYRFKSGEYGVFKYHFWSAMGNLIQWFFRQSFQTIWRMM